MLDIYESKQEDVHPTLRLPPKARPKELLSQGRRRSRATSVSASFHKLPIPSSVPPSSYQSCTTYEQQKKNSVVHASCIPETLASIKIETGMVLSVRVKEKQILQP